MSTQGLRDDSGVTLVELIVYLVIGGVILSLMAGLFINGLNSQAETTDRDIATGRAAVITNSIQTSIRNANVINVGPDGKTVRAVVATGDTTEWECRAWQLTADKALVYKAASSKAALDAAGGWATLATDVVGTLPGVVPFAQDIVNPRQLTVGFIVTVNEAKVPISSGVTAQATIESAGSCW